MGPANQIIDTKCDTIYPCDVDECSPITIPKHEPIKKVYVEMVKRVVESENDHEN